ncbi:MAG: hypothetical protein GWN79_29070, partial [Actinobacteria bacterium]|nr:hypothetical protein [Actinomycetota bacterium]
MSERTMSHAAATPMAAAATVTDAVKVIERTSNAPVRPVLNVSHADPAEA